MKCMFFKLLFKTRLFLWIFFPINSVKVEHCGDAAF